MYVSHFPLTCESKLGDLEGGFGSEFTPIQWANSILTAMKHISVLQE